MANRSEKAPIIPRQSQTETATILGAAFERTKQNVLQQNIVPWKFYPSSTELEPDINSTQRQEVEVVLIKEVREIRNGSSSSSQNPEAYSLQMGEDGTTTIEIITAQGGLHALETFSQLFYAHSQSSVEVYSPFAPVSIFDSPDFEYRGLNLDISRNWIPPKDVMRTIEVMAATKLNNLHLHAVDAQSWPLEIPAFPNLATKGAYSPSQIWSTKDLEDVQSHGSAYGVEVFLEIDLPGHARAIGYAYPDLVAAADKEPWSEYALQPPAGQLRLNSTNVTSFLSTLLDDLLPRSSRWSSKFHIGGDELNKNVYTLDPTVRSSSPEVLQPLVQAFVNHVISTADAHGVRSIVWEEMLLDWNLTLPDSIIVQNWRSTAAFNSILERGHKALFGSSSYWYLDCGHGFYPDPSLGNPNLSDPKRQVKPPYLDFCSPYKNWRHIYSYDPLDGVSEAHRHLVVGGEVHLWSELTDSTTLDGMLWPRAAAAAEVMWSGSSKMPDESTTRRLAEWRERLVARGVHAGMVQMEWCLRHEGRCSI